MIFAMTAASVQRCLQSNVLQGDVGVRVTDVVETWAHRHNAGFSLLDGSGGQIALSMPVPHGLLLTSRVWESYCVPVLQKHDEGTSSWLASLFGISGGHCNQELHL